jgi:hypothetical protein
MSDQNKKKCVVAGIIITLPLPPNTHSCLIVHKYEIIILYLQFIYRKLKYFLLVFYLSAVKCIKIQNPIEFVTQRKDNHSHKKILSNVNSVRISIS